MKRFLLAQRVQNGATWEPVVPAAANGTYAVLADWPARNRMLVKVTLPDGTAKTAATIADITIDEDGRQLDINAEPLGAAARTAIKTMLTNAGFPVDQFDGDGIDDRAKLLRFMLRRLAQWQDMTPRELLDGWDA